MKTRIKWLGVVASVGMFAVLIMGSAVTNTGSEQGCGKQWPLCHGKLIPQMAVKTAIEFSHRAVVGFESVLILALAACGLYFYWRRREMRLLATLMVSFLFLQAALGAWAVMYPQEAGILALHFGVSLIAFASVLLTTVFLFEVDTTETLRDRRVPHLLRAYVWGLTGYTYLVVYSGAYVRHSKASLACHGWPLCNGSPLPTLNGTVGPIFGHRLGAGLLVLGVGVLVAFTSQVSSARPDLYQGSVLCLGLVVLQAASGAIVVWTRLDLFSALLHAGLVGLFFGGMAYLCVHALPRHSVEAEAAQISRLIPESGPARASH